MIAAAEVASLRAAVLAEARTWLGTPWRHRAAVKGPNGAVDCARFVAEVFIAAGVIERFDPGRYPQQWFLHHKEERVIAWLLRLGGREIAVDEAQPADILVYKIGNCYAHGAILLDRKRVIHSYVRWKAVVITDTFDADLLKGMPRAFDVFASRQEA